MKRIRAGAIRAGALRAGMARAGGARACGIRACGIRAGLLRAGLALAIGAALSACAPTAPEDTRRGVGFDDGRDPFAPVYSDPVVTGPIIQPNAISSETPGQGTELPIGGAGEGASADAAGNAAAGASGGTADAPLPPVRTNNPGISDEQDFNAVASRETIESDRARLEAQRRAYKVIAPTALPRRPSGDNALIVEFALSTTNTVGQPLYRRSGLSGQARFARNCAKYPSSDLAQEAFLKAGGPERDRYGLDPDGDGFACYWDPTPFRLAVAAAGGGAIAGR